jgi:predicted ATP-dependent protease
MIDNGTLIIDITGEAVGQVNGLSVYSIGDMLFGRPSRITARTFMGRSGVIDIEREAQQLVPVQKWSGPLNIFCRVFDCMIP